MNIIGLIKRKYRAYFIMRLVHRARHYRKFYSLISDILENSEVQKLKGFTHHADLSVYEHSMHVAYWNYRICRFLNWDVSAATRAGMLHDMFMYDWHQYKADSILKLHGFVHPGFALSCARENFELSQREEDIILKHMFPLTLTLPKYRETCVIILTDKICAFSEVIRGLVKSKPRVCRGGKY